MDSQELVRGLKANWYLVAILVVCVVLVGGHMLRGGSASESSSPEAASVRNAGGAGPVEPPRTRVETRRLTSEERVLDTIAQHEARIIEEPHSDDTVALRLAVGNLYRRIGRYDEAINSYESLILERPDWDGIRAVYDELATCYERLGDTVNARRIYAQMLDRFPEDSAEYEYAQAKLMGEI